MNKKKNMYISVSMIWIIYILGWITCLWLPVLAILMALFTVTLAPIFLTGVFIEDYKQKKS
jgi:uncharacterized membrane protein